MNKEQMDKYAYELMVKNNPDEAVKNLLLKDKQITNLQEESERLEKNQRFHKNGVFSLEYDKETLCDMVEELQQENENLKEGNDNLHYCLNIYKLRSEKAIEYIKENIKNYWGICDTSYIWHVEAILKGDDNSEQ